MPGRIPVFSRAVAHEMHSPAARDRPLITNCAEIPTPRTFELCPLKSFSATKIGGRSGKRAVFSRFMAGGEDCHGRRAPPRERTGTVLAFREMHHKLITITQAGLAALGVS